MIFLAALLAQAPCGTLYRDAYATQAVQPAYPKNARERRFATIQVLVTVAPDGKASAVKIRQSSGDPILDDAALDAVRKSTFAPKIVNCRPESADYIYVVLFDPNIDSTATPNGWVVGDVVAGY